MPVIGATWATLPQVTAELEKGGQEIVQVLESPDGLAVLYRTGKWEARQVVQNQMLSVQEARDIEKKPRGKKR